MTRRAKGTGTVYQRGDGRWVARAKDPATGKTVTRYAPDENTANDYLGEMTARKAKGDPVADTRITLKRYAEEWIASGRAERRRAESTLYQYESRLRVHIYPGLGHLRLAELRVDHVERFLDDLLDKGLRAPTVEAVLTTLGAVLSDAVRVRHLAVNVARLAEMPYRAADTEPEPIEPPTVEQVRALLEAMDEHDPEIGRLLRLLAGTGVRIGEALAATWTDLDLDEGLWQVRRTVTIDRKGRSIVGSTTKGRAARLVRLPAPVVEALREQRREVTKRRLAALVWHNELDWVWPTVIGTHLDPSNVRKRVRAVADPIGFEGTPHDLRHLFASLAVETAELTVVAKLLGHRRASITSDTYAHLLPGKRLEVVDNVSDRLFGVSDT
jgi:integrase